MLKSVIIKIMKDKEKTHILLKPWGGLVAASVIICLFILMATFLKSVLFGLILAFFILPMYKWYANVFLRTKTVLDIIRMTNVLLIPFKLIAENISTLFRKKDSGSFVGPVEFRAKKAFYLTLISLGVIILISITTFSWVSVNYISKASKSFKTWADDTVQKESYLPISDPAKTQNIEDKVGTENYLKVLYNVVDEKLSDLIPGFDIIQDELKQYISTHENQKAIFMSIINYSGGIFSTTMGIIGGSFSFALNFLLTLFFFTFFLQKMGLAALQKNRNTFIGGYVVQNIYSSKWLPKTNSRTQHDAEEIIDHITKQIRIWVRGYMSIIIIETIVYVTIFLLLGIKYAVLLGCIAGCTVLLPFIGPMLSMALTMGVCMLTGHGNVVFISTIAGVYLVMNCVVEQLFLLPNIVGEALGLNNLETIMVVLLGGLFAGLPGMIFAVPVAAILKYLIPKIYEAIQEN